MTVAAPALSPPTLTTARPLTVSGLHRGRPVPAVVFGGGLTSLGTLRSLGAAGIPAYLIGDPAEHGFVRWSRWYRQLPGLKQSIRPVDLADVLDRVPLTEAVLFPTSDAWVSALARLKPAHTERFHAVVPARAIVDKFVDKEPFSELLQDLDIPHPRTLILRSTADLQDVSDAVLEGSFLKPRDSQPFMARFGVKGFQLKNRVEAEQRLSEIEAAGLSVVLQQFIPGPGSEHFYVEGYVGAEQRILALFARRRLRIYPPDFGNSSYMESIPLQSVEPAVQSMRTLLSAVGYRGIFSAEFKRDVRDGEYKLLEVNTRPWWYVDFPTRCGLNICEVAYRDLLELPPGKNAYVNGRRLVYPYYDIFALRQEQGSLPSTLAACTQSWLGAAFPVFRLNDPLPGAHEVALGLGRGVKRAWSQLTRR
jgi:D-aspartate ligase